MAQQKLVIDVHDVDRGRADHHKSKNISYIQEFDISSPIEILSHTTVDIGGILERFKRGELDREELRKLLFDAFSDAGYNAVDKANFLRDILSEVAPSPSALLSEAMKLPEQWPLYAERENRRQTPLEFYDQHWRKYADGNVLYQEQGRKMDPKLVPAIHTYCSRTPGYKASDFLPPPRHERTNRLAEAGDPDALGMLVVRKYGLRKRSGPENIISPK
jgi:hypothetical protein